MKTFKYSAKQKFRVIIDEISIYTTAKQIRNGIGNFSIVNRSIADALLKLEDAKIRNTDTTGIGLKLYTHRVQLDEMI